MKKFKQLRAEALSNNDKAKRLADIKKAVEKINKSNADKAKKDALQMMKDSGMFDESVDEANTDALAKRATERFKGIDKKLAQRVADAVKPKGQINTKLYVELGNLWDKNDKKGFEKHLQKNESVNENKYLKYSDLMKDYAVSFAKDGGLGPASKKIKAAMDKEKKKLGIEEGAEKYTVQKGKMQRKVDGKTADKMKKQGWKLISTEEKEL